MDFYTPLSDALLARSAWDGTWVTALTDAKTHLQALSSNATFLTSVSIAQIAAVFISAFMLFIIVVAMGRRNAFQIGTPTEAAVSSGAVAVPEGQLGMRWRDIMSHMESAHESDWKLAVIEADKLVDDALAHHGYSGDSFGDRLMSIEPGGLVSLDGLWWAHKVRNRLAHEMDYFLRYTEARQAMAYYEQTLQELHLV